MSIYYRLPLLSLSTFVTPEHLPSVCLKQDSKLFYLTIDTGLRYDMSLNPEAMSAWKYEKTERKLEVKNFYGLVSMRDLYSLDFLRLGGIKISNVEFFEEHDKDTPVIELSGGIRCRNNHPHIPTQGTLGMGIFERYNILFDFKTATMKLYRKGVRPASIGKSKPLSVSFERRLSLPVVQLDTNYGPKRFLIDTGSTVSCLSADSISRYSVQTSEGTDWVKLQLSYHGQTLCEKQFRFFGENMDLIGVDGIIGMNILGFYSVFFDNKRNLVYFF